MSLRAAGIEAFGDDVALLELPEPPPLETGQVLIDVKAAGVGNWEEFVRTGGWGGGRGPPLALGGGGAGGGGGPRPAVGARRGGRRRGRRGRPRGPVARRRRSRDDPSAPAALPRLLGRAARRPSTPGGREAPQRLLGRGGGVPCSRTDG